MNILKSIKIKVNTFVPNLVVRKKIFLLLFIYFNERMFLKLYNFIFAVTRVRKRFRVVHNRVLTTVRACVCVRVIVHISLMHCELPSIVLNGK